MKNLPLLSLSILTTFIFITSCAKNNDEYIEMPLQSVLENQINATAGSKAALLLPASNDFITIPGDINNNITVSKVELGKLLFHETIIAENSTKEQGKDTYSCASCHHAAAGFQSGLLQGIGEGGIGFGSKGEGRSKNPNYLESELDMQPIRSPSILNVAYQEVMLWNGQFGATGYNQGTESSWVDGTPIATNNLGFEGVETQAIAGMDVHRLAIDEDYILNCSYKGMFDEAFPDVPVSERYNKLTAGLAIAAYERTVLSNEAPFQKWLSGDGMAMEDDELEGATLFFGKGQCYSCHSGPGLNGMSFHALGMNDLAGESILTIVDETTKKGRGGFTKNSEDDYKFKTPQLYNLKDVRFYGHGGSFSSVRDVISYKNEAKHENKEVLENQLDDAFQPLNLSEKEIDLITLFVENSLYDPNLKRYQPTTLPSGSCVINADSQSSIDMGCN
ncbi:cytochrome-c peroxidase [Algibacter sp. Ld11]|uniref:cytochrome-c peroxidase n=1 Tax=Algibacter sp. Ld11 TaxID=649150 RepID=UPI00386C6726